MPELDENQPLAPTEFDFQNPNATPQVETHPDSLAEGFLKEVDPEHLPIVEPLIKKWDAGVTKRFQNIHDTYKPYKELGELEDVQAAWQLAQAFNEDPVGTLKKAFEVYLNEGIDIDMSEFMNPAGNAPGNEPSVENEQPPGQFQGMDPNFLNEWDQVKQVLGVLSQDVIDRRKKAEDEQNRSQFDNYLKTLHDTHGDFDNDWVTAKMASGVQPEDAIKQFNEMIKSFSNSQQNKPGPIIFGGGPTPGQVQDVDVKSLSPEQRRAYIAARLTAAANENP